MSCSGIECPAELITYNGNCFRTIVMPMDGQDGSGLRFSSSTAAIPSPAQSMYQE